MLNELPLYVPLAFLLTTLVSVILFYYASNKSKLVLFGIFAIMIVQIVLSYNDFYLNTYTTPPRFFLIVLPTFLVTIFSFATTQGRSWINSLDEKLLTILSIVRIPVELILFSLFTYKVIPELMTFSGRNFDILTGITAPIIYYFVFVKKWNSNYLLIWNVLSLILILNIVFHAIFSIDSPIQKFAFHQPNRAVLHFPFILLPTFVAPSVLFSHLVMIYRKGK